MFIFQTGFKQRTAEVQTTTSSVLQALSPLDAPFDIAIKKSEGDTTTFYLKGAVRYDPAATKKGVGYDDVRMSCALPGTPEQIKAGDLIHIAGKPWTVTEAANELGKISWTLNDGAGTTLRVKDGEAVQNLSTFETYNGLVASVDWAYNQLTLRSAAPQWPAPFEVSLSTAIAPNARATIDVSHFSQENVVVVDTKGAKTTTTIEQALAVGSSSDRLLFGLAPGGPATGRFLIMPGKNYVLYQKDPVGHPEEYQAVSIQKLSVDIRDSDHPAEGAKVNWAYPATGRIQVDLNEKHRDSPTQYGHVYSTWRLDPSNPGVDAFQMSGVGPYYTEGKPVALQPVGNAVGTSTRGTVVRKAGVQPEVLFDYPRQIDQMEFELRQVHSHSSTTSVRENPALVDVVRLGQNYPNPVDARGTYIPFELKRDAAVSIKVYDINGRPVAEVANASHLAGRHEVPFVPPFDMANGTYVYVLEVAGKWAAEGKMVVVK